MAAVSEDLWSARDTTPAQVEAALRDMFIKRQAERPASVPARVLNLVAVVDRAWRGEIANRLRGVGRNHPSRTIVLQIEPDRERLDARAVIASETDPRPGEFALVREMIVMTVGTEHVDALASIVDPLVISDLPTVLWSPHGHPEAVEQLLGLAQVVLLDSVDEPDVEEAMRYALHLGERAYVVDLAWLRSTPWRERVAAAFDPPAVRPRLRQIEAVTVRHHPVSGIAGLLFLGWLSSRLGWRPGQLIAQGGRLRGRATARHGDVSLCMEPVSQEVPGLAGVTISTAAGTSLSLDRGRGGLRAVNTDRRGNVRAWTVMGASRGEPGILGEGIRQALLRDHTYRPALVAAEEFAP
jgi:Glucose-6-phosphate dehydrogenase subunit